METEEQRKTFLNRFLRIFIPLIFPILVIILCISLFRVRSAGIRFQNIIKENMVLISQKHNTSEFINQYFDAKEGAYIVITQDSEKTKLCLELFSQAKKDFKSHIDDIKKFKDDKKVDVFLPGIKDNAISSIKCTLDLKKALGKHPFFNRGFLEALGSFKVKNLCQRISRFSKTFKSDCKKLDKNDKNKIILSCNSNFILISLYSYDNETSEYTVLGLVLDLYDIKKNPISGKEFYLVYLNALIGSKKKNK